MNCLQRTLLGSLGCLPWRSYHGFTFVFIHQWLAISPAVPVQLRSTVICLKPGWVQLTFTTSHFTCAVCCSQAPCHFLFLAKMQVEASSFLVCTKVCAQKNKWLRLKKVGERWVFLVSWLLSLYKLNLDWFRFGSGGIRVAKSGMQVWMTLTTSFQRFRHVSKS